MPPKNDKRKGNNDAASKAAAKVPGVLRCAYSDIASLEEVVMRLCADAGMRPPTLRHKGDDRTYSDALLRRTLCAIHARAPKLPSHAASFDVASSLEETHARTLAAHFKTHSAPGNVLCYGVRRKRAPSARDPPPPDRGTPGGANIAGRPDLEVSVASAATTSLLGVKHWRTFHERVGDALMTHVLVHGSVFVPSALMRSNSDPERHGSHLQLCGAPVSAVGASRAAAMARHKRAAQAARVDRTTTPTQRRRKNTEKRKRREDATNATEADEVEPKNERKRAKKTFNTAAPGLDSRKALDPSSGDSILGTQSQASQPGREDGSEGPEGGTGTAMVSHSTMSPVAVMLRRVGGFVADVVRTANPFMSPAQKMAPSLTSKDGGVRKRTKRRRQKRRKKAVNTRTVQTKMPTDSKDLDADVVAESDPGESARAHEPQDAVGDARRPNKPLRLSSWRRRKLARERASAAAVDADADPTPKQVEGEEEGGGEEEEDSFVPETPDFDVVASSPGDLANDAAWARLGAAANASSSDSVAMAWDRLGALAATGKDDDDEIATPPRLKKSAKGKRGRAEAKPPATKTPGTTPGKRTPSGRSLRGDPVRDAAERPSEVVFDTSRFMHKSSYSRTPGLPRGHALNALGRGSAGARRLYSVVFGKGPGGLKTKTSDRRTSASPFKSPLKSPLKPVHNDDSGKFERGKVCGRDKQTRRVPRRHRAALLPLLRTMLRKAARCPYASILERHCPMPERTDVESGDAEAEAKSLLASFTPPVAVARFLWSVIRKLSPREMLGGAASRSVMRRFLLRLVVLRRFEACTLHEAMTGLKVSEFPWLFGDAGAANGAGDEKRRRRGTQSGPASAALARRRDLQRWVRWLVADLAIPLLRSHFYCTETESHRLRVFYYRKGVWARLTAAHLAAMTVDPNGESRTPVTLGGTELPTTLDTQARLNHTETGRVEEEGDDKDADLSLDAAPSRAAYRRLPKRRARLVLQRHLLGFSKLRLLPKSTGLRPVAMLGRPAAASFRSLGKNGGGKRDVLSFRPVNTSLQGVFDVLRHEAGARPGVMGANVSDYRDVHRRLAPFIRRWRSAQKSPVVSKKRKKNGGNDDVDADDRPVAGPEPVTRPPYIVAADVKGAFDSIPLAALERVASELVGAGEYSVSRLARVVGGAAVGVRTKTRRIAAPVTKPGANTTRASSLDETETEGVDTRGRRKGSKHIERKIGGVVIDLANPIAVHKDQVLELLREHLRRNVVRSGGVYLLQTTGIPQGSVLSTLLCAVFYAHLEQTHGLRGKSPSDCTSEKVLCRWTDDLLHVSFDRDPAEGFLSAALEGFAEYGCEVNTGKTSLNFDYGNGVSAEPTRRATRSASAALADTPPIEPMIPRRETVIGHGAHARRCIAWCGLLIDSHNLEVLVDYTRYAGDWAREAVTVPGRAGSGLKTPSPFSRLDRRVVAYLRPKCTALLYDHSVNSPRTARLNVYQSFLLAAIKTHCFIAAASEHPSARTKTSFKTGHDANSSGKRKKVLASRGPSPAAVHAAITAGIRYMEGAVRHHAAVARATLGATGQIQRTHVRYLGLHAFAKIFSRKQSRHAGTLALLKRDMGAATMRAAAKKLAPVVDDAMSTTFDQIRF